MEGKMRKFGNLDTKTFTFTWIFQWSIFLLFGIKSFTWGQLNMNFEPPSGSIYGGSVNGPGFRSESESYPVPGNSPSMYNEIPPPPPVPQFNSHGMTNPSVTTINLDFGSNAHQNPGSNPNQNQVEYYKPHDQKYQFQYQPQPQPQYHQYKSPPLRSYENFPHHQGGQHYNKDNYNENYRQIPEEKQREPYKFDREPPSHHHHPLASSSNPAVHVNEQFVYNNFGEGHEDPASGQSFVMLDHQSENSNSNQNPNPPFYNRNNNNNNNQMNFQFQQSSSNTNNDNNNAYENTANMNMNMRENIQVRNLTCLLSSTGLNCKIM